MKKRKKTSDITLLETDSIIVKESIFLEKQLSVITKRHFKKGEKIFSIKGPIISKPTKYSFSVGLDKHIDPLRKDGGFDFGHYLNHSCDPNTFISVVDGTDELPFIEVIARQNIEAGEELTFDYASLEYETVANVDCKCATVLCRSTIHGFKDLPNHIVKKYKKEGMIPTHLLKIKQK